MGSVVPWKQLLLNALESNSHLKHSTFMQLVCLCFPFFFFFFFNFNFNFIFLAFVVLSVFQATVGTNGTPSNRTVVFRFCYSVCPVTHTHSHILGFMETHHRMGLVCFFRGFQDNTDNIQINTDTRTRKVVLFSIRFSNIVEIQCCWNKNCFVCLFVCNSVSGKYILYITIQFILVLV